MSSAVKLLPEVSDFLTNQPLGVFIDGGFVPSKSGKKLTTENPANASRLASFAAGQLADVHAAISAAQIAFEHSPWAMLHAEKRSTILFRLADLIDERAAVIAQLESLDVGKPLNQAMSFDVPNVAQIFRYYANLSTRISYREALPARGVEAYTLHTPYGACGFIIPWNFPFLLLGWNVAPALAAGNTAIIKPSEETPLSALYFALLAKEAGVPDGVVNVVTGMGNEAGAALASHPEIAHIAFTGSPEVGRQVAEAAAKNLVPCKLELGGKGAAVVLEDVDLEKVTDNLVNAITLNSGQVCCTATRWVIHESLYERFLVLASKKLQEIHIGDPFYSETQMGPVISDKQRQRVLNYLKRGAAEGADVILEPTVPENRQGYFITPAILSGGPENCCAREEIFGPAAYVLKFRADHEAVDLVNSSRYGLANSVWSGDISRATKIGEALIAGNSWINAHNVFIHGIPYGGVNLSGLGGGVLGADTLYDYLRPQSVVRLL